MTRRQQVKTRILHSVAGLGAFGLVASFSAHAIDVTLNTNANQLAAVITAGGGGGLTVVGATLSGQTSDEAASTGTYTNASGTYGIGPGVIMSTGNAADYGDGPNSATNTTTSYGNAATVAQQALLFGIDGKDVHYDVSQLDIEFTTDTGDVFFNVLFGSEEFEEFIGSPFIDAFGLFVNGVPSTTTSRSTLTIRISEPGPALSWMGSCPAKADRCCSRRLVLAPATTCSVSSSLIPVMTCSTVSRTSEHWAERLHRRRCPNLARSRCSDSASPGWH
jgi:hypothetical protein